MINQSPMHKLTKNKVAGRLPAETLTAYTRGSPQGTGEEREKGGPFSRTRKGLPVPGKKKPRTIFGNFAGKSSRLHKERSPERCGFAAIYSKESPPIRKSNSPIVRMPLSSRQGVISSLTTMIFWKESSMRRSGAVSCLLFSSSGMDRADCI